MWVGLQEEWVGLIKPQVLYFNMLAALKLGRSVRKLTKEKYKAVESS